MTTTLMPLWGSSPAIQNSMRTSTVSACSGSCSISAEIRIHGPRHVPQTAGRTFIFSGPRAQRLTTQRAHRLRTPVWKRARCKQAPIGTPVSILKYIQKLACRHLNPARYTALRRKIRRKLTPDRDRFSGGASNSKFTPCLRRLAAAFSSSHSNSIMDY